MANNTRNFVDLDLNFTRNPVTGDIAVRLDENAIKRSIRNLVLTKNYERPFHSEIGSQVTALMFELADPFTEAIIRQNIIDLITTFEPRVELLDVGVVYDEGNNSVSVRIDFKILNTFTPLTMDLVLERTR